ncbi:MAG: DUF7538 family protein [Halorubrum sp.]
MHDSIAALVRQEGWRAEGSAARVHYDGGGDRVAIEFYAVAERVLYWRVPSRSGTDDAGDANDVSNASDVGNADANAAVSDDVENHAGTAAPIPRDEVPDPLRRRIREDLDAAGVDPAVERRSV